MDIVIKFKKLDKAVELPKYETLDASGADLRAFLAEDVTLEPMERTLIPTGFQMQIPSGYEAQIRPRSGMSIKNGITLINCIGTIDADYRGEVKVPVVNLSKNSFVIKNGDRIAQMVIMPVIHAKFEEADQLTDTQRGDGGFGSTGV